ncbi:hypothetical protein acsn021_05130 [Anaerocolumna cellulosilytica]|uniref:Uncharacterized protein n=1 Tax=Anaerocolumna cellulosilytica TaxID=433286 RepID=A0A6S6QQS5_9FIRM|nr:6-hydroxymethylpterin diphosphokinase MptE-like protein [Anaerocolumna cellulosilytica]MBB5195720.1 hypothetical protein [Anaerocolumna cellulosilytica]BCJ92944.1 hypothetical protein acsn021_05130 [Anaerocolumna cellulosilytica]
MSYLKRNLETLQACKEKLHTAIKDKLQLIDEDINFNLLETKEDYKTIVVEKDGYEYRLNSLYKPVEEANIWAESLDLKDIRKVFLMFGFGHGLYIQKLLKKLNKDDKLVVYEPSCAIFQYVLTNFNLEKILSDERVRVVVKDINDIDLKINLESNVNWENVFSQRINCLPQYNIMYFNDYTAFLTKIKHNNDRVIMMRNTEARFGKIVVENTFTNLKYIKQCNILDDYIDVFDSNLPAIIVAAGPSLKKNVEFLKDAKNKAVIFAVDRALEYLYDQNIIPDYAVTVDPLKLESCFAPSYEVDIPLFAELHSNAKILAQHKGKKIFYNAFDYINYYMKDLNKCILNKLNIGTSVATAAFSICVNMKFKRIILVGQDLSYGEDGTASHIDANIDMGIQYNLISVEGYNGNMVMTRNDWFDFLKWFEAMIEVTPNIEVINATEGGAMIKGARNMLLKDVIQKYCLKEVDCKQISENMRPAYSEEEMGLFIEYLKNSQLDLVMIKQMAQEACDICDTLLTTPDYEDADKNDLCKRLTQINEDVTSSPVYGLLDSYITEATSDVMGEINTVKEDEPDDIKSIFEKSKLIYGQIVIATDEIANISKNNNLLYN